MGTRGYPPGMLGSCWLLLLLVASSGWAQDFPLDQFRDLRAQALLSVPSWDAKLGATCRGRSAALAATGALSHFDDQGRGPGEQLLAQGFPPGLYAEVLGAGEDPRAVWQGWLASPAHRAVLVDPRWTSWAWGATRSGSTTVWVVRFGAP